MPIRLTSPSDYAALHHGISRVDVATNFRWRSEPLTSTDFERALFAGVSLSWTAFSQDEEVVGLVQLLGLQPADRVAEMVVAYFGDDLLVAGESILLALEQSFRLRDLRKIYFHLPEQTAQSFEVTLKRLATVEGVLKQFLWIDNEYNDVIIAAVSREQFLDYVQQRPFNGLSSKRRGGSPIGLDEFTTLVDDLLSPISEHQRSLEALLRDSIALLELVSALDDLAGREIAVEAVVALPDRAALLRFAADIAAT